MGEFRLLRFIANGASFVHLIGADANSLTEQPSAKSKLIVMLISPAGCKRPNDLLGPNTDGSHVFTNKLTIKNVSEGQRP